MKLFALVLLPIVAAGPDGVLVPKAKGMPAPWLAEDRSGPHLDVEEVAYGTGLAVARLEVGTWSGYYAYRSGQRVVGPLKLPGRAKATWMGVGADDTIYARAQKGTIFRGTLAQMLEGKAERLENLGPDVTQLDAAGRTVVALDPAGAVVHVSTDRGERFDSHGFVDPIGQVFARPDDVIVALGTAAHTSTDGGRTWSSAELSLPRAQRDGMQIGQAALAPKDRSRGCDEGTLAADGKTWVTYRSAPKTPDWAGVFGSTATTFFGVELEDLFPASQPPPPPITEPSALEEVERCRAKVPERKGLGGAAAGIGGRSPDCRAFECQHRPRLPGSPTSFVFLHDAVEAGRSKDLFGVSLMSTERTRGRRFSFGGSSRLSKQLFEGGPPTAFFLRKDQAPQRIELPVGCEPSRAFNLRGLTLVLCAEPTGQRVYTLKGIELVEEGLVEGRLRVIDMAEDGTVVLQSILDGKPILYLRRPKAPGATKLTKVAVDRGQLFRALAGGRALVMGGAVPPRFASVEIKPRSSTRVGPKKGLTARSGSFWTRLPELSQDCYRDAVTQDPSLTGQVDVEVNVKASGAIGEVRAHRPEGGPELATLSRCLTSAAGSLRLRIVDPEARRPVAGQVHRKVSFSAFNTAAYVGVAAPGQKLKMLRKSMQLDAAVHDVRVRDGRVEIDGGGWSRRYCPVPSEGPFTCGR